MKTCDLHIHSNYSDGTCAVEEIVKQAKLAGLTAIALTDHNNVDGLNEFLLECEKHDIEGVCGVEISCDYLNKELHIVALCFDKEHFKTLKDLFEIPKRYKEESNVYMANKLKEQGYDIDYEQIKKKTNVFVNRVHFANALMEKRYISSVEEGFDTILSKESGTYKQPKRLDVFEIIKFISSINAVSVLAHPLLDLSKQELNEFLTKAVKCGLKGMETNYSTFTEAEQIYLKNLADGLGLLKSGGSDFHGSNKPQIKIGVGKGNLVVPYEYLIKLRGNV